MLRLYTDGSCLSNGRSGAKAGYAVVFPDHLEASWGAPMEGATNQAAELRAIYEGVVAGKAVQGNPAELTIRIITDSEFSIHCLTKWVVGWKKKNWITAAGKPVVHRVIIEKILTELRNYAGHVFIHVKAHTGAIDTDSRWNQIADDLAQRAATTGERAVYEESTPIRGETTDIILPGIPLALVGPPISESVLVEALKANLGVLDPTALKTALISALKKTLSAKSYELDTTKVFKTVHYRVIEKTGITITRDE
jgi:ribonuclease HI